MAGTLTDMKARIADEISRADLTSQIANAINDAINLYQTHRFYFNETPSTGYLFDTIPDQETYSGLDDPNLPWFYDVDDVFVIVGVNKFRVKRIDPTLYRINQMPFFKGQPYNYMYLDQTFSFSPIPNTTYTMIVVGQMKVTAPLIDTEVGNPWMTDAEILIRQCAKRLLYENVILDQEAAQICKFGSDGKGGEQEAYDVLKAASAKMTATGIIQPMDF